MNSLCIQKKEKEKEKEKQNKKQNKKFIPPTLEDINNYIKEKSLKIDGKFFYDYFTEGKWTDSKGNKVKNWKQKLLTWDRHQITINKQTNYKNYKNYEQRDYNDWDSLYANKK